MNPAKALLAAAERSIARGEAERAREFLMRVIGWGPSPEAAELLGHLALATRDWVEAESWFRTSLRAGYFTTRCYAGLGISLFRQGLDEYAEQAFAFGARLATDGQESWADYCASQPCSRSFRRPSDTARLRRVS